MRKFIISDIHGLGNVYYSIMNYLDNIKKEEEIELYINGDLFDHGIESTKILIDVYKRIKNQENIIYLGGNHELLMYQFYQKYLEKGSYSYFNDWYDNGGYITDDELYAYFDYDFKKLMKVVNYVSNLKIYHKFKETIKDKQIVLVHAKCPETVNDICDIRIKDDNKLVFSSVWSRNYDDIPLFSIFIPEKIKLGNDDYFTIIGHTPNKNKYGYFYNKEDNYLNIDGGCAGYACGLFEYDHIPLVEVKDNYLQILTFNNNNEIIYGNYFDGEKNIPYTDLELSNARKYLNNELKVKKYVF